VTWIRLALIAAIVAVSMAAQDSKVDALYGPGRSLVRELTLRQDADDKIFASLGQERAEALLTAVLVHGQSLTATVDDWDDLHRALTGLMELNISRNQLFKASLYAAFQEIYYHNNERDEEKALAASRQALDLVQRSGLTANIFLDWMNLGQALVRVGRVDEALEAFRSAQQAIPEPTGNQAAHLRRYIVQAEIARHDVAAGRKELEGFSRDAKAGPPYFEAQALLARGDVLTAEGNFKAVPDVAVQALGLVATGPDHDSIALDVLNELMTCVLASMESLPYDEAVALAKRIDQEIPGLPIPISGYAQAAIRMRRRLAGDIDGVLHDDTARLEQARAAGNVPLQIEALHSIALTYKSFHSVSNEITTLEEAKALENTLAPAGGIFSNVVAAQYWARGSIALGNAYADEKDIGSAAELFDAVIRGIDAQTAASIRSGLADLRAQAVVGKARCAELDGRSIAARELLANALKSGGRFDRAQVLLELARVDREAKPDVAPAEYEQAITAMRVAKDRNSEAITHLELARFLTKQGDFAGARAHLKAAAATAASVNFADAEWRVDLLAGTIAEKEGSEESAIGFYKTAVSKLETIRASLHQQEQRESLENDENVTELYQRLVGALTRQGNLPEAWRYVERGKARAFVESLHGRRFREELPKAQAGEIAGLEKRMLDLRVELSPVNESVLRSAGREPSALQDELEAAEAKFALAREQAGLSETRGSRAVQLDAPSLAAVQAKLPEKAALLEYFILRDELTAFVLSRRSSKQLVWKIKSDEFRDEVLGLRTLLMDPRSGAALRPALAEVSSAVWSPVELKLPKDIKHLIVVPGSYLSYLPFEALKTRKGRDLIDDYSVSYLPSASTLLLLLGERPKMTSDLFLGALGNVPVDGLDGLPGTLHEINEIAQIYPAAHRESEHDFTHQRATQALTQYNEVHFATHGLLDEQAPLFSALLVAPAAGQPSRLSLYELMDLRVKAQLVVLSACETGLGKVLGGDEITGLTRTLLSAGAATVVASLWKVSDDSTAMLMDSFYRSMKAGNAPSEALRKAALQVKKKFPEPFYWAPFTVTGAT